MPLPEGQGVPVSRQASRHGARLPRRDDRPVRIRTLLAAGSEPNLYIVPPDGCFGWDLDGDDAVRIGELEAELGPLPATAGTDTPHGRHAVYWWPAGEKRPGQVLGVVTRWGGENDTATGYLIGAGSRIGEKVYRAHRGDDGDPLAIVDLPAGMDRRCPGRRYGRSARPGLHERGGRQGRRGPRHGYLRDQARHLRGLGLTGSALFDAVSALNLERCDPPKAVEDVARAIGDAELRFPADSLEGYGPDGVDVTSPVRDAIGSTEPPACPIRRLKLRITAF